MRVAGQVDPVLALLLLWSPYPWDHTPSFQPLGWGWGWGSSKLSACQTSDAQKRAPVSTSSPTSIRTPVTADRSFSLP